MSLAYLGNVQRMIILYWYLYTWCLKVSFYPMIKVRCSSSFLVTMLNFMVFFFLCQSSQNQPRDNYFRILGLQYRITWNGHFRIHAQDQAKNQLWYFSLNPPLKFWAFPVQHIVITLAHFHQQLEYRSLIIPVFCWDEETFVLVIKSEIKRGMKNA